MYLLFSLIFSSLLFYVYSHSELVDDDIEFTLYRPNFLHISFKLDDIYENKYISDEIKRLFDPNLKTHIYSHGFQSNTRTAKYYSREFFVDNDVNFIAVDWTSYSGHVYYFNAKTKIKRVSVKSGLPKCVYFSK